MSTRDSKSGRGKTTADDQEDDDFLDRATGKQGGRGQSGGQQSGQRGGGDVGGKDRCPNPPDPPDVAGLGGDEDTPGW